MIVFRADGNSNIGLGHVMRNLSIADAFRQVGETCCFIMAEDVLRGLVEERGYEVRVLGTSNDRMPEEMPLLTPVLEELRPRLVFVDSYFVTEKYLKALHKICSTMGAGLVYLDDVLAFPYACDVLINYNIFASEDAYKKLYALCSDGACPRMLLGTSYAPLRAEFQRLPDRNVRKGATDVLISTGGADFEHICVEMVRAVLHHDEWKKYRFHFVVGAMNEDKPEICELARQAQNVFLHENVRNMSELMQSCDVAISAAGSTMYELCATQTPTITYILADNQIPGAEGFASKGVLQNAGDVRELGVEVLVENVLIQAVELLKNYEERVEISRRMKNVVDGNGAERVAKAVEFDF